MPLQQNQQTQAAQNVVAKVNGVPITKPELDATVQHRLAEMQRQAQAQGQQLGANTVQEVHSEALDLLIESRLVEEYALEEGPGAPQQEVASAVEGVKQQLAAQQVPFKQFLAAQRAGSTIGSTRLHGGYQHLRLHDLYNAFRTASGRERDGR